MFTDATVSVRESAHFVAFASGKSALRALSQAWLENLDTRELMWHMLGLNAHAMIDGAIDTP